MCTQYYEVYNCRTIDGIACHRATLVTKLKKYELIHIEIADIILNNIAFGLILSICSIHKRLFCQLCLAQTNNVINDRLTNIFIFPNNQKQ